MLSGAGWRATWLMFAAVAAVVGAVAVASVPAGRVPTSTAPVRLRPRWFLCPRSRPLLLAAALVGVGSSIWWAFCVDAMRASGIDATTARLVYAACGVAGVVASLTGALVDRTGQRRVHHGTVLGVAAALGLLAWVATGAETAATPLVALAAVTFGVTYNGVIAVQGLWSAEVFAELPSAGLAAVNTSLTAGTLVGPSARRSGHRAGRLLRGDDPGCRGDTRRAPARTAGPRPVSRFSAFACVDAAQRLTGRRGRVTLRAGRRR